MTVFGMFVIGVVGISLSAYALDIQQIAIRGNALIPESTILSQIESKVGFPYNAEMIAKDLQNIYNLGFFAAVDVEAEEQPGGVQITFLVQEYPLITRIEFTGNKEVKQEKLEAVLTLTSNDVSDPVRLKFYPLKIQQDIANLKQFYREKGFHNAQVKANLIPDASDPQGGVTLQYQIEENEKVSVRRVMFKGNTVFAEKELRKNMITRKKGLFAFLTGSGMFEKKTFAADLERVKFFYIDHGYIDVRIVDYKLDFQNSKSDLYITIAVEEGELYTISAVGVTGNTVYPTEDIQKVLSVIPGDPFSRSKIWQDRVAVADLYARKGYLTPISENMEGKLLIDPKTNVDRKQRQVALTYDFKEGVPHFLNRLTITGNQKTRDKVIRRELKFQEGELFQANLLGRGRQNVMNLGFFDEVEFDMVDGPQPQTADLSINVKERSIGSFNLGGGWGSAEQWSVLGGISTTNLFGLGHAIEFSTTIGSKSYTFNLSYTIPRFLDSYYLLGLEGYNLKYDYESYASKRTGGGIRFGRRITDDLTTTLRYLYEVVDIRDVEDDASAYIKAAEGQSETSSLTLFIRYSGLNSVILPTKGLSTSIRGEMAGGFLQGENNFYKVTVDNSLYIPLFKNVAIRMRGEYAHVQEYGDSPEVPIFERFFGGGTDLIRGYEERSIGPKDENGDPIGGNTRIVLTSELIIPVQEKMRLLAFFDAGDVYGPDAEIAPGSFKRSVGVGARLYTPFGLVKIDWGYKLKKEEGESDYEVHFGFGGLF